VDKVRAATEIVRKRPDLKIEGPIQWCRSRYGSRTK
jgi:phosphotransacetylase